MSGPVHPLLTPLRLRVVNLGHAPRPQYNALSFASGASLRLPHFPSPSPSDSRTSNGKGSSSVKPSKDKDKSGAQDTFSATEGADFSRAGGAALTSLAEGGRHQVAQTEALYLHLLEELGCACGELLEAQQEPKGQAQGP